MLYASTLFFMSPKKNPIDKDKIAENPGLLPYAHHMGSAIIKPIDKGRTKGLAMDAMYEQTEGQLLQIKEQVELLVRQAQAIHDRIDISEKIYKADCGFKPVPNKEYYLYDKGEDFWIVSMVGPTEWGKSKPYEYLATVTLLSDSTWKVIESVKEELNIDFEL